MNICVLRVSGAQFAVDDFVATSRLTSDPDLYTAWHKGEPRRKRCCEDSGFILDVCEVELEGLNEQAKRATAFLSSNYDELKQLMEFPGVENARLDFAIAKRDVAAQVDLFPVELVRLAGSLNLELMLSQYATLNVEEEEHGENKSEEIEDLLNAIRSRFESLGPQECRRESFLAHLRSLGHWESDGGNYPDPGEVAFPEKIHISFAVCNQECGVSEFIVDGSTQECQRCGDLMFRTDVAEYQFLKKEQV
jgi:hypothetical protein